MFLEEGKGRMLTQQYVGCIYGKACGSILNPLSGRPLRFLVIHFPCPPPPLPPSLCAWSRFHKVATCRLLGGLAVGVGGPAGRLWALGWLRRRIIAWLYRVHPRVRIGYRVILLCTTQINTPGHTFIGLPAGPAPPPPPHPLAPSPPFRSYLQPSLGTTCVHIYINVYTRRGLTTELGTFGIFEFFHFFPS